MSRAVNFTKRETQVAVLVAQGLEYKDIGRELGISHHTVRALVVRMCLRIPHDESPPLRRLMRWMLAEPPESTSKRGAA